MQPGAEGSSRSLILSLLVDQCLFLHPDQLAQLKHRQPAFTVGSLTDLPLALVSYYSNNLLNNRE
jgi:hypothetical protein